jgi:uncharacterized protein YqfB (UPF0267 family)
MVTHELKTWPPHFGEVVAGRKTVEVRRDDRGGFNVGDLLWLREYDPRTRTYSGRFTVRRVTHVLTGWGVEAGFAALSLAPV